MKRRTFRSIAAAVVFLGISSGCQSPPAEISDADRTAIRAQIDTYVRAALGGDAEAWGDTLAEDVVLMPPTGTQISGRRAAIDWLKAFPQLTAFQVDVGEVTGSGDVAYARGTYTLTAKLPDGSALSDGGAFLEVHRRASDGTWPYTRMMFHSDNLAPRANAADAVRTTIAAHWDAINRGDMAAAAAHHTSDFTMTLAGYERTPEVDVLAKTKVHWLPRDVHVQAIGPGAIVASYTMDGSTISPAGRVDRRPRRVTEVWVYQGNAWKEAHHHDSVVAP